MIRILQYADEKTALLTPAELPSKIASNSRIFWVDIENPNEDELAWLENTFQFHRLCIDDCRTFSNTPKLDDYEQYLFLVIHETSVNNHQFILDEVNFFIGRNFLVSVHQKPSKNISNLNKRYKSNLEISVFKSPITVLHTLLEDIFEDILPVLNSWEDQMEFLESEVFAHKGHAVLGALMKLKHQLAQLRRNVTLHQDVISKLIHTDTIIDQKNARFLFRDLFNNIIRLHDLIETQRDALTNILEIHYSALSQRIGENSQKVNLVMQRLTIITTIFMPLSFIAGLYGMNFENIPELKWTYGYFIVLTIMGLVAFLMYYSFKRKRWF